VTAQASAQLYGHALPAIRNAGRLQRSIRSAIGTVSLRVPAAVVKAKSARHHHRPLPAWVLTGAATAFAVSGLWATIQHSGT
jgi:hypothetical protein